MGGFLGIGTLVTGLATLINPLLGQTSAEVQLQQTSAKTRETALRNAAETEQLIGEKILPYSVETAHMGALQIAKAQRDGSMRVAAAKRQQFDMDVAKIWSGMLGGSSAA